MNETLLWRRKLLLPLIVLMALLTTSFMPAHAQSLTVSGVVKDATSGETLPGVNVIVKGTSKGTITDANGAYSIGDLSDSDVLIFTFVGYAQQEVQVNGQAKIEISLATDTKLLQEVVVVGYGEQKKSVVTGAISSVKAKDFQDMPIVRLEDALKGRVSGVTIASSSGAPGAGSSINIRGITSINNSDPLIVVDGVVITGGLDYLNSSDIESIEVLKDAASAAIYGTKAASGVILVTTKKGKSGGMQVNYNGYMGSQSPARKIDLLNATQYASIINEQVVAAGGSPKFANPSSLGAGTDWQSVIFNNHAKIQNHEISISGGNEKSTYYSSVNYFKQEGIVATSVSSYERLSARFNSSHKIKNWLNFGNNFSLSHTKSKGDVSQNDYFGGPLASAINLDPTTPLTVDAATAATTEPYLSHANTIVRDDAGNAYGISPYVGQEMTNPAAWTKIRKGNYGYSDNLVGNLYVEVEPVKALKFRSSIGGKLSIWGGESFTPIYFLSNTQSNLINNSFNRGMNRGFDYTFTNTLSYNKTIGDHNIYALIGTEARDIGGDTRGVNGTFLNSPATDFKSASANWPYTTANSIAGGYESQPYRISSTFAKVNYDYQGKYLLTGIVRRDGSSHFGSNHKYGTFPSASVGWVVSNEDFLKANKLVNFLKVRAGYGVNGNDNLGTFYYTSTIGSIGAGYVFGNNQISQGYAPGAPANPDLKWEQTSQSNIGIDATVLQDFTLTVEYFVKKTKNMLLQPPIPGYIGASDRPWANIASLENKGFEIELGYNKKIGGLGINLKGNLSSYRNKVTSLGAFDFLPQASMQSSTYEISRKVAGQPVGEFYGFEYSGVFQDQSEIESYGKTISFNKNPKPGDFKWKDLNNDGVIDDKDRTYLGNPTPTMSFGFSSTITFKGFDLVVFAQGVSGNKIFNQLRRLDVPEANYTTQVLSRWTGPGTSNSYARLVEGDPSGNFNRTSQFYLQDGSYFRIKNIQLGYNLPKSLLSKVKLQKMRVYVSGNNLITFTKYTGFDPEIGGGQNIYGIDRGKYPQAKSFNAGLNLTF